MLNLGDKLRHIESGIEAEYCYAVPTATHGFVHFLKTAQGYVQRLTGDLETEFARPESTQSLSETDGSSASNESALLDALIQRLQAEGVIPAGNPVEPPAGASIPLTPTLTAPNPAPAPVVPDVSAHLPAASQTDAPTEVTPSEPESLTPPPNSIPL
jgi:hypothetical protein